MSDTNNLQIRFWPADQLKPAEYNPRQLTEEQHEQLRQSLDKFGFVDPVLVNTHPDRYGVIVGGHQRVRVATESLGLEAIPCVEVYLDIEGERELNVRLNKNTGEWDWELLANYFNTEELLDWGFTERELGVMEVPEEDEDPEETDGSHRCPTCGKAM